MFDVLRFWLDKGVDGFRVDVIWHLIKDDRFRDNPPNPDWHEGMRGYDRHVHRYTTDRPEVHEVVRAMRRVVDEYDDRVLIGEIYLPVGRLVTYYGEDLSGVQLPFNFHLLLTAWNAPDVADLIRDYEAALPPGGWPNWVLGNHDNHRIASRVGRSQARVAAMLLLTLRGTPTLYYGDEIGMRDVPIPPDRVQDPSEKGDPGIGVGRDPCRTPMQWEGGEGAGFTTGEPWLPIAADADRVNVAVEAGRPRSMLTLHKALLALRRREPALHVGAGSLLETEGPILAYTRAHGESRFLVVLNFGPDPAAFDPPDGPWTTVLSTALDRAGETIDGRLALRPDEGLLLRAG